MTDQLLRNTPTSTAYLVRVAALLVAAIVVTVLVDLMLIEDLAEVKREHGGLETITAVFFGLAVIVFFATAPSSVWQPLFEVPAMFALFAMRELDFDKMFTPAGILSTKFYVGDSPLGPKLIGGAVTLFATYVLFRVVWCGGPSAWRALRAGEIWPRFAILAGVLVVFAKSIDGLARKLGGFGIGISDTLNFLSIVAEEFAEAGIAVCGILAILARWKGRDA